MLNARTPGETVPNLYQGALVRNKGLTQEIIRLSPRRLPYGEAFDDAANLDTTAVRKAKADA